MSAGSTSTCVAVSLKLGLRRFVPSAAVTVYQPATVSCLVAAWMLPPPAWTAALHLSQGRMLHCLLHCSTKHCCQASWKGSIWLKELQQGSLSRQPTAGRFTVTRRRPIWNPAAYAQAQEPNCYDSYTYPIQVRSGSCQCQ